MKSKINLLYILLGFILGLVVNPFIPDIYDNKWKELEIRFDSAFKLARKLQVPSLRVRDLAEFQWDKVCVITAYMGNDQIKARTGIKYYDFTDHEGQWGLLFIDAQQKPIPVKINNVTVDIAFHNSKATKEAQFCASHNNAKLVFNWNSTLNPSGFPMVELVHDKAEGNK